AVGRKTGARGARGQEGVKLFSRRYDEGVALHAIGEDLSQRAVPTPRGRLRGARKTNRRLLGNRRYVGDWTWGVHPQGKRFRYGKAGLRETARGEPTPRRTPSEQWVIITDDHEPLIDRDTFARGQDRLIQNRTNTTPCPNGGSFLLTHLLVCGHCGRHLYGKHRGGMKEYICSGYILHGKAVCYRHGVNEQTLLKALIRKLQQAYLDPAWLQELRDVIARQEAEQRSDGNLNRLRERIEAVSQQINQGYANLVILAPRYLDGVTAQIDRLERERRALEEELHRAQTERPAAKLEETIAAAEGVLWQLQDALQAE